MTPLSPEIARVVDSIYPPARQALAYQIAAIGRPLYFLDAFAELALLYGFWRVGSAAGWRDWFAARIRAPWLAAIHDELVHAGEAPRDRGSEYETGTDVDGPEQRTTGIRRRGCVIYLTPTSESDRVNGNRPKLAVGKIGRYRTL